MKRSYDTNILKRGQYKQHAPSPNTDSLPAPKRSTSTMPSSTYHGTYASSLPNSNIMPYYPVQSPSFPSADQAFFNYNNALQNAHLKMYLPSGPMPWLTTNNVPALFDPSQPPPPLPQQPPPQPPQPPQPTSSEMKNLSPYTRARPSSIRSGIRPLGVSRASFYNANTSPSTTNSCSKSKQSDTEKKTQPNGSVCSSTSTVSSEADSVREGAVHKKAKRRPMSMHYATKEWNLEDAERALLVEQEFNKSQRTQMLILKFPDPELSKDIIKQFSPHIENVHFQQPSTPRYCFVQIKSGTDLNKVKEELSQVPFGVGKLSVEFKNRVQQSHDVGPEDIDPYTLYIGNLPTTINVNEFKSHFPKGRVDIGYAQRMKFTRYAFIRFENIDDSIAAFKVASEIEFGSRSLVIRFRRKRGNIGMNTGQVNPQPLSKKGLAEDIIEYDISPLNSFTDDNYSSLNGHFSDISPDINESSQDSKATAEYELSSETTHIKATMPNLATGSTTIIRPIELTELIEPTTVATQVAPVKHISKTLEIATTTESNEAIVKTSLGTINSAHIKDEPIDDEPIDENVPSVDPPLLMGSKLYEKLDTNVIGFMVKEELIDEHRTPTLLGSKLNKDDDVFDPLNDAEDFTDDELLNDNEFESDYNFVKKNNLRVSEEPETNYNTSEIAAKIKKEKELEEIKNAVNSNNINEEDDSLDALYESLNPDDDAHF